MPTTRQSVLTTILHPDGREVLKVASGTSSLSQGASANIAGVLQAGKVLDPSKVPAVVPSALTPASLISPALPVTPPPPPPNRYYINLSAHNMTDVIAGNNAEDAWRQFCAHKGIAASDQAVLLTEFAP